MKSILASSALLSSAFGLHEDIVLKHSLKTGQSYERLLDKTTEVYESGVWKKKKSQRRSAKRAEEHRRLASEHGISLKEAKKQREIPIIRLLFISDARSRKYAASAGISSTRSRNGGMSSSNPLRR